MPEPFQRLWRSVTGQATNKITNSITTPPPGLTLLHTLQGHTDAVFSLAWAPDGSRLASGSRDQTVRLWDPASFRLLPSLEGHNSTVSSLVWAPDGSRLASGSLFDIRIWDPASARLLSLLEDRTVWLWCLAWSPDGSRLATGSIGGPISLWDPASFRLLSSSPEGHTDMVHCLA